MFSVIKFTRLRILALLFVSGCFGWISHVQYASYIASSIKETPIRLDGYRLISPLVICDSNYNHDSRALSVLLQHIKRIIKTDIANGNVSKVSVYFRYLKSGEEFYIEPDERFNPASLIKLPLMMQYYRESESNPSLLLSKKEYGNTKDSNFGVSILPKETPTNNNSYTVQELIDYMIKYSDNNSFDILYSGLGKDTFNEIYKTMNMQFPNSNGPSQDYATAYQISLFFRMLYSATYLNNENSEKALDLLTQVDYRQGLVRDIPSSTLVAHKFGITTITDTSGKQHGELHDCGIVYKSNNPYFLCVMTKSDSIDLKVVENSIATISSYIFNHVK